MLKGYKTIIFNAVMTVAMIIQVWTGEDTAADADTVKAGIDGIEAATTAIWGVGNVWLRSITDSPIFQK